MRCWLGSFLLALAAGGLAQGASLTGSWDLTFELLPNTRIYSSDVTLNWRFASGWRVESESKIYSDGLLRYQNFSLSGGLGEVSVWGKIYFHVQELRYQKLWLNAELPLDGGTFRGSFNHWASASDYTSSDRSTFGPWPCVEVVSWQDAWRFMARDVYVMGPVRGYSYAGGALTLHIGENFPSPNRFQIYIPAANVAAFEVQFGTQFWATWVGQNVCVRGTIKGYRYTSGGPGNGGYSVAEVSISSPSALALGSCAGILISPACSGTVAKWFWVRHGYMGQTVYVQGPVASISGPGTYHGYANHYRVRIGGGDTTGNRVEVILPYHPGWSTAGSSYSNEVCVEGRVTLQGPVAAILPPDLISVSGGPCCGGGLPGTFANGRFRYTLSPWTVTADFGDCGSGFAFRRVDVAATGLPLCCGVTSDLALSLTRAGFGSLSFALKSLPLSGWGFTADLSVSFTSDAKSVRLEPKWPRLSGCLTVYGDIVWVESTWTGVAVYGWRAYCWVGDVRLEVGIALDRPKMNSVSPLSFRSGEGEYVGLAYRASGCCGGDLWFDADLWFGEGEYLLGLRRLKLSLEVPIAPGLVLFTRGMLDRSKPSPLEYWNVGWELAF